MKLKLPIKFKRKRSSPEPNLQYCWWWSFNVLPRILPMHCYTPALLAIRLEKMVLNRRLFILLKAKTTIWELLRNQTCLNDRIEINYPWNMFVCQLPNRKTLVLIRHFKLTYEIFQLFKPAGKPLCGCSKLCEQLSKPTDWTLKNDLHLMKGQAWKINTLQIIMTLHDSIPNFATHTERQKVSMFVWSCVSN